jgi:hypothetical protein
VASVGAASLASSAFLFREDDDVEGEKSVYLVTMRVYGKYLVGKRILGWKTPNRSGLCFE